MLGLCQPGGSFLSPSDIRGQTARFGLVVFQLRSHEGLTTVPHIELFLVGEGAWQVGSGGQVSREPPTLGQGQIA